MRNLIMLVAALLVVPATARAQFDAILPNGPGTYLLEITVDTDGSMSVRELNVFRLGDAGPVDPLPDPPVDPTPPDPNESTIARAARTAADQVTTPNASATRAEMADAYRALAMALRTKLVPIAEVASVEASLLDQVTEANRAAWLPVRNAIRDAINASKPTSADALADGYEQAAEGLAPGRAIDWERILKWLELIKIILEALRAGELRS